MEKATYNKRTVGKQKEKEACAYLEKHGYQIICSNFRCKFGEVDIIAKEGEYLVFIEVKYRKNAKNGMPQEAVNFPKQKRITITAKYYLCQNGLGDNTPCRFDVVEVLDKEIKVIKNAFEAK